MSTWSDIPFSNESGRKPHVESFGKWGRPMTSKERILILLRGLHEKNLRLRVITRDHFNSGKWDTEENGKKAARLLDEIIELATTARNELT